MSLQKLGTDIITVFKSFFNAINTRCRSKRASLPFQPERIFPVDTVPVRTTRWLSYDTKHDRDEDFAVTLNPHRCLPAMSCRFLQSIFILLLITIQNPSIKFIVVFKSILHSLGENFCCCCGITKLEAFVIKKKRVVTRLLQRIRLRFTMTFSFFLSF